MARPQTMARQGPSPTLMVPCVLPISGGLFIGRSIKVKGIVDNTAKSFNIFLRCGPREGDEVALLVHVQVSSQCLVCNDWRGRWGTEVEERCELTEGQAFVIVVRCREAAYEVSVNGKDVLDFEYRRTPLRSVAYIAFEGDVSLTDVSFEGDPKAVDASCCNETEEVPVRKKRKKKGPPPLNINSTEPEDTTSYQPSTDIVTVSTSDKPLVQQLATSVTDAAAVAAVKPVPSSPSPPAPPREAPPPPPLPDEPPEPFSNVIQLPTAAQESTPGPRDHTPRGSGSGSGSGGATQPMGHDNEKSSERNDPEEALARQRIQQNLQQQSAASRDKRKCCCIS